MKTLSPMRQKILTFISEFTAQTGYPPSVREICDAVGLRSPSTVHSHLKTLKEGGYLEKDDRKTRAMKITGEVSFRSVPVVGRVTAGRPILAYEEIEGYVPYEHNDSGEYFALRVRGDSMIGAGIMDGDTVVVRRQETANHGDIVVALFEDEATVKRLWRQNGKIFYMPENDAYEPIDGTNGQVIGRVVSVYRTYQ